MLARPTALLAVLVAVSFGASPGEAAPAARPPIPAGWKVEASATGDLTGDGVGDTAVVIRQTNPRRVVRNEGLGTPELDTNPRQLLIFEKTASGFRQVAAATNLIPPAGTQDSPCLEDPLADGGISIARQTLSVRFNYWLSCGSWGTAINTYKFRRLSGRFRLIGFDRTEFMRNSGLGEEVSVNFLTSRKSTTPYAIDDSVARRLRWSRTKPQRIYLDTFDIRACLPVDARTSLC